MTKVAAVIVILLAFVLMTMHTSAALPMEVPGREQAGHEQQVGQEQVGPEQAGRVTRSGPGLAACLSACQRGTAAIQVRLIEMSILYQAGLHSLSANS